MSFEGLFYGLFFVGVGIFSICGAACDWEWFINSRKARFFVTIFGRNGARIFYGLLGSAIVLIGVLMALGLVSTERKRQRLRPRFGQFRLEERLNARSLAAWNAPLPSEGSPAQPQVLTR